MPSPEHQPTDPHLTPRYLQIARFPSEETAGRAYVQAQDAILRTLDCDLSVFRLQLHHIYHVTVLGDPPPRPLDRALRFILTAGQPADLPEDILQYLFDRRSQATRLGSWVERHRRPLPEEGNQG